MIIGYLKEFFQVDVLANPIDFNFAFRSIQIKQGASGSIRLSIGIPEPPGHCFHDLNGGVSSFALSTTPLIVFTTTLTQTAGHCWVQDGWRVST